MWSLWVILIFFTAIYIAKELTSASHLRWQYLQNFESWLNIAVNVCFIITSFFIADSEEAGPAEWQYHIIGFGLFFTWVLQTLIVGRMPQVGLYIEIFKKVLKTFLTVFIAFACLFVAFATSFLVIFPPSFSNNNLSHLKLPFGAFGKVLVMMLGEVDYASDDKSINHLPFTSYIFFILFIVIVSIVIMNLLFGLAVADIQVQIFSR